MNTNAAGTPGGVLLACTIGLALGFSVIGVGAFGIFVSPLEHTFGWSRGEVSIAHTTMSYTAALVSPFVGAAFDRWGVRRVLLPSMVGLAAIMAAFSQLPGSLLAFYGLYALLAVVGAGTSPIGYMRCITLWFDRNRGLALGIAQAGVGIGTAVIPPIVQYAVDAADWRAGYLAVAGLILCVSLPVAWRFMADPGDRSRPTPDQRPLVGLTLAQALRERTFWQMVIAFPILGVFTSGLMAHLVPLLGDRGIEKEAAAAGMSVLGVALIVGRLLTGWLLDRIFAPYLATVCILVAMVGVALLWSGVTGWAAFGAIALLGFAIGAEMDFMSYLISRYQGTLAYARIYGLMYGVFIAGSGLGPPLMGFGFDAYGSYDVSLMAILVLLAAACPLFLTLGKYREFGPAPAH